MKQKNGFTLIELLAVIVILAIIALIATPIVLGIIEDSKNSSQLQSAIFYLDAVENAIGKEMLDGSKVEDGTYDIIEDGDLCKDYKDGKCINKIGVDATGELPKSGTIKIEKGRIKDLELVYENKTIGKDNNGDLVFVEPTELLYRIGEEVTFNPGDGDRTWNVIGEDKDTVMLMMTENLGDTVKWHSGPSCENIFGPKDALEYLNSLTIGWSNVDPIESYSYTNNLNGISRPYGYQKVEITNGVTTLTDWKGNTTTLDETNKAKARILSIEEILEISSKINENLTIENLEAYITRHLSTLNSAFNGTATNVDEIIEVITSYGDTYEFLKLESKHVQLYGIVLLLVFNAGLEPEYNLLFPEYLYNNLNNEDGINGYWTLSTEAEGNNRNSWQVGYEGVMLGSSVWSEDYGVRPVITIPKTKLK